MKSVRQPASLPLFQGRLRLARLRRSVPGSVRAFAPGEALARQGQPLGAVHVVLSGLVSFTSTSNGGRRALLALVGPGGVLGHESVLPLEDVGNEGTLSPASSDLEPSAVDVRAWVACTTLALPVPELCRAFERDPHVALWLAASLRERVLALQRGLARALTLPVKDRVLDLLFELAAAHGEKQPWGTIVRVPLSQDDIGALVGATRESVNRAIRQLGKSGVVSRLDGGYALRGRVGDQGAEPGVS